MNRIVALGLLCVIGLVGLAPGLAAAADLALVIGNHNYRKAPDAESAEIDAREVAEELEQGGYEVMLGIDMKRDEMRRALARFGRRIGQADRLVIFFSGHALRSDGVTYLAPVDQENDSLVEVMMDGVPLDLILRLAERKAGSAVVFVDAAQYDGFTPTRFAEPGLADINAPRGVMVVSAAAPGRAIRREDARQSRFGRMVVRRFLDRGTRVSDVVRSLRGPTWVTGSVDPGLVLVPRGRGRYSGSSSSQPGLSDDQIEANLRLDRDKRHEIQEVLNLLGFDTRGVDGVFGPGTRTAIRLWQRSNNLTETGYLTGEQVALLDRQSAEARDAGGRASERDRRRAEAEDNAFWASTGARGTGDGYRSYLNRYSDGLHADEARQALKQLARTGADPAAERERTVWRAARLSDRPGDYRDYLTRYPSGIWRPEAEARMAEIQAGGGGRPEPVDPAVAEADLGLSRNDRLSIEQRLQYLGFNPGPQDGFFDDNTRWAIEGYQRSRRLQATGYLDRATVAGIVDETGGARQGVVIDGAAVLRELLRGLE